MLVLSNMAMEPSNVGGKKSEPPYVIKVLSTVILELHNVRMEQSNVRKKNKGTTKCNKRTITYDVGTAQYEDEIVKCEKKKLENY